MTALDLESALLQVATDKSRQINLLPVQTNAEILLYSLRVVQLNNQT